MDEREALLHYPLAAKESLFVLQRDLPLRCYVSLRNWKLHHHTSSHLTSMKRVSIVASFLALVVSSSAAFAIARRHIEYSVTVAGISGSKIRGTGLITPSENQSEAKTAVTLKFERDVAGAERPWHVHHGTCAKAGTILGGAKIYPSIKVDAKGTGIAKLSLPIVFPDTGVFYLSIHESAANMSKVVACGDLMLED